MRRASASSVMFKAAICVAIRSEKVLFGVASMYRTVHDV